MKRRLFNIVSAVSLVMCVATVVLWICSYRISTLRLGHLPTLSCYSGSVAYTQRSNPWTLDRYSHSCFGFEARLEFANVLEKDGVVALDTLRTIVVPFWALTAVFSLLAFAFSRAGEERQRRSPPKLCPACGYDLRASPDRCPECGAVPAQASL